MVAQLNYDILCILFRFLDEDTLYNCSIVNKEFNFIASQNLYHEVALAPGLLHPSLTYRKAIRVSRPRQGRAIHRNGRLISPRLTTHLSPRTYPGTPPMSDTLR